MLMLLPARWSDPRAKPGTVKNSRGAGVFWGPDYTKEFLKTNHLGLVVRSHEPPIQGFEVGTATVNAGAVVLVLSHCAWVCHNAWGPCVCASVCVWCSFFGVVMVVSQLCLVFVHHQYWHNKRVLTVFSASKYCGQDNQGAYLVLDPHLSYAIHSFLARTAYVMGACGCVVFAGDGTRSYVFIVSLAHGLYSPLSLVLSSVVRRNGPTIAVKMQRDMARAVTTKMIIECVCANKAALYSAFEGLDTANSGMVSKDAWAHAMHQVTQLDLPWLWVCRHVCSFVDKQRTLVNYLKFLDRCVFMSLQHALPACLFCCCCPPPCPPPPPPLLMPCCHCHPGTPSLCTTGGKTSSSRASAGTCSTQPTTWRRCTRPWMLTRTAGCHTRSSLTP